MRELKVGDKVKVRTWEDMAKEFKLNTVGSLETPTNSFTDTMAERCGTIVTIAQISKPKNGCTCFSIEEGGYAWDETMIEKEQKYIYVVRIEHGESEIRRCYSTRELAIDAVSKHMKAAKDNIDYSFMISPCPIDE